MHGRVGPASRKTQEINDIFYAQPKDTLRATPDEDFTPTQVSLLLKKLRGTLKNSDRPGLTFLYPSSWEAEWSTESISVYNPHGVGALQFSTYRVTTSDGVLNLETQLQNVLVTQQTTATAINERYWVTATFFDL
jgi:hypothetical protein